ncbi:spore coat associated protein SpaC [Bacillaceae bacterium]
MSAVSSERVYLGIMTCRSSSVPPFGEKGYFRSLSILGQKCGLPVFVFIPDEVDFAGKAAAGYRYVREGKWKKEIFPLPRLVYDRCFYPNGKIFRRYQPYVKRLKEHPEVTFLGLGLHGKWQLYELVSQSEKLKRWLPKTKRYTSFRDLLAWLNEERQAIMKPVGGSLGTGVIKISRPKNGLLHVEGRAQNNRKIAKTFPDVRSFATWLQEFMKGRKYLIQQYLNLTTKDGVPFDVRILAQKNALGEWGITGIAVRKGEARGLTSNLHGGGKAEKFLPFLRQHYAPEQTAQIQQAVQEIATELPAYIESRHGRLVELGIDVGIEQNGNVWIIEANSKPGRRVFQEIGETETSRKAIANPLHYARYLLNATNRRVTS